MTTTATRSPGPGNSRLFRRLALATAVAASAALALSACGGESADASTDSAKAGGFTLHVGLVTKVGVDGVLGWADNQQILQKDLAPLGVSKVVFSTFATGPTLNAALTSGSVDVASMGDTPALELRAGGFASRVIAISGINSDYWLVGKKGGPTTLAGLAGKKVSAAPGTAPEQYLTELLAEEKLTDQIHISNLQTNDAATALRAGSLDAFVATGSMAATFAAQGYPIIDKASQHTDLYTTSENVASDRFLTAHPGFAKAWGTAFAASVQSINASPKDYWAFAAKQEKVSVPIATTANPLDTYPATAFSDTGIEQLTASYNFLSNAKLLKSSFDLNSWFDRS